MVGNNAVDRTKDGETRRSFMKKGTVATVGVGAMASGAASAQEGQRDETDRVADGLEKQEEGWKALIFVDGFHSAGQFTIVSDVVDWVPNYGEIDGSWFSDYNTRQIRWQNTGEVVPLFVAQDAPVGQFDEEIGFVTDPNDAHRPQLYEMNKEWAPFSDSSRLLTVNVNPVSEDEADDALRNEDWWATDEGGSGGSDGAGDSTQ